MRAPPLAARALTKPQPLTAPQPWCAIAHQECEWHKWVEAQKAKRRFWRRVLEAIAALVRAARG